MEENKRIINYKIVSKRLKEIRENKDMPKGVKHVLKSLLKRLGGKHICWPSIEKIMEDTSYAKSTVILHLNWLRERNILNSTMTYRNPKTKKRMAGNVYDLSNLMYNSLSDILRKHTK